MNTLAWDTQQRGGGIGMKAWVKKKKKNLRTFKDTGAGRQEAFWGWKALCTAEPHLHGIPGLLGHELLSDPAP